MTVRRLLAACFAVLALWGSTGCGDRGNAVTPDETTDPVYQQAQDLKKQGRYAEALADFLKVIDRRGESGAPESHLEAGALYLNWAHDPVEAYHHFSKYLELEPTGPRADMVRGQRDAAKRELARTLLAPANGAVAAEDSAEIAALKQQVAELQAENAALRGNDALPVTRAAPVIPVPDNGNGPAGEAAGGTGSGFVQPFVSPAPNAPVRPPPTIATAPPQRVPVNPPSRPAETGRRTHTVTSSEKSLWGIAREVYGSANNAKVQAIYQANRGVMRSPNDLRPGMVLVIP